MANCWQIVVAMVRMLLVLCICAIVHLHKIEEAQVWLRFPVLLIMLRQIDKLGGLIYTETGKQTAYQYLCCQYKCHQCSHCKSTALSALTDSSPESSGTKAKYANLEIVHFAPILLFLHNCNQ